MQNAGPLEWATETMRLSVFPLNEGEALKTLHWENCVGAPPEKVDRPPQLRRVIEEGTWNNGRLQVDSQQGQIHWRAFSATPNRDGPMNIGSLPSAAPPFRELLDHWLRTHCPIVNRIAFGAVLIFPTSSLQEAYTHLDRMLPGVSVDTDGSRDLMYRINRRRKSRIIDDLEINRLATWSAAEGMALEVVFVAGVPSARPAIARQFCRLELDVNTVPIPDREFRGDKLLNIVGELVDAASEIALNGDVP